MRSSRNRISGVSPHVDVVGFQHHPARPLEPRQRNGQFRDVPDGTDRKRPVDVLVGRTPHPQPVKRSFVFPVGQPGVESPCKADDRADDKATCGGPLCQVRIVAVGPWCPQAGLGKRLGQLVPGRNQFRVGGERHGVEHAFIDVEIDVMHAGGHRDPARVPPDKPTAATASTTAHQRAFIHRDGHRAIAPVIPDPDVVLGLPRKLGDPGQASRVAGRTPGGMATQRPGAAITRLQRIEAPGGHQLVGRHPKGGRGRLPRHRFWSRSQRGGNQPETDENHGPQFRWENRHRQSPRASRVTDAECNARDRRRHSDRDSNLCRIPQEMQQSHHPTPPTVDIDDS